MIVDMQVLAGELLGFALGVCVTLTIQTWRKRQRLVKHIERRRRRLGW